MMRYVRKSEANAIDNILIAQADRLSARGPEITDDIVEENISALNKLLDFYLSVRDNLKPLPKLLDGKFKPSPKLGEILTALHEAQISGDILSKDDAINFIKTI